MTETNAKIWKVFLRQNPKARVIDVRNPKDWENIFVHIR